MGPMSSTASIFKHYANPAANAYSHGIASPEPNSSDSAENPVWTVVGPVGLKLGSLPGTYILCLHLLSLQADDRLELAKYVWFIVDSQAATQI